MARLSLRGIKKSFKTTNVLRGIDLDIGDREFVVFVGPSGCGKSTLLRLIAGLDPITEGEFILNDQRMNDVPPSRRGIAMVFQSYALYPHMDVYEDLKEGLAAATTGATIFTTLSGYTEPKPQTPDFELIRALAARIDAPIVAEGRFNTPEPARAAIDAGAYAVVVGAMINNPREITKGFATAVAF